MQRHIRIFFYYYPPSFYYIDRQAYSIRKAKPSRSYLLYRSVTNDASRLLNIKLSMIYSRSIIIYTSYHRPNISISCIVSMSTMATFVVSTKSTIVIRYPRYRSVSPPSSYSTFTILSSFIQNSLLYTIH